MGRVVQGVVFKVEWPKIFVGEEDNEYQLLECDWEKVGVEHYWPLRGDYLTVEVKDGPNESVEVISVRPLRYTDGNGEITKICFDEGIGKRTYYNKLIYDV